MIQSTPFPTVTTKPLTPDNLPRPQRIPYVNIRLRHLREDLKNLDNLHLDLHRRFALRRHHVQQRRGQGIKQTLADEHTTEVVLRRRALELEDAADTVQGVNDEVCLLGVVLVQKINEDLETSTSRRR